MTGRTRSVFLLVVLAGMAGCFGQPQDDGILLGTPQPGHQVVFEGSEGSTVTVTVLGNASRSDGGQTLHDVLIIEYVFEAIRPRDITLRIEEAVEIGTGVHVRHDRLDVLDHEFDPAILDEVFFRPFGVAGGLGLGPYWGQMIAEGRSTGQRLDVRAATADQDRRCVIVSSADDRPFEGYWLPITAVAGPNQVCSGDVFPTEWTADMPLWDKGQREAFKAVSKQTVSRAWSRSDVDSLPVVERTPTGGPLALLVPRPTISGFDSMTAHEKAVELDAGYANFVDDNRSRIVSAQFTSGEQSGGIELERSETSHWTLTVARPGGAGYAATVTQTVHTPLLDPAYISYGIRDAGPVAWPNVPLDDALRGMSGSFVYDYSLALFGDAPVLVKHHMEPRVATFGEQRAVLQDRFLVWLGIHPPSGSEVGGVFVVHGWLLEGDSKNGWLTYARVPTELRLRV